MLESGRSFICVLQKYKIPMTQSVIIWVLKFVVSESNIKIVVSVDAHKKAKKHLSPKSATLPRQIIIAMIQITANSVETGIPPIRTIYMVENTPIKYNSILTIFIKCFSAPPFNKLRYFFRFPASYSIHIFRESLMKANT